MLLMKMVSIDKISHVWKKNSKISMNQRQKKDLACNMFIHSKGIYIQQSLKQNNLITKVMQLMKCCADYFKGNKWLNKYAGNQKVVAI